MKSLLFVSFILLQFANYCKAQDTIPSVICEFPSIPQFPGGNAALQKYLNSNLKKHSKGTVGVQFKVDCNGKLTDAKIVKGLDSVVNKQVLDIIIAMPNWVTMPCKDYPIPVLINLPIKFSGDKNEINREDYKRLQLKEIANSIPDSNFKTVKKDSVLTGTIMDICNMSWSHWYGVTEIGVIKIKKSSPEVFFYVLYSENELVANLKINQEVKLHVKPLIKKDKKFSPGQITCMTIRDGVICVLKKISK